MDKNYKVRYSSNSFIVDITVTAYSFKMHNSTVTFYDFSGDAIFAYCNVCRVEIIED